MDGTLDGFSYGATYNPGTRQLGSNLVEEARGKTRGVPSIAGGSGKGEKRAERGHDNSPLYPREGGTSDDEDSRARHDYALDIPFFFDAVSLGWHGRERKPTEVRTGFRLRPYN